MCAVFVACIGIPFIHQLVQELRQAGHWRFLSLFEQPPTHDSLRAFEDTLARNSELARKARFGYQMLLTGILRQSTDSVVIGRDGFLFYRTEVDMAGGRGFLAPRAVPKRIDHFGFRKKSDSDPVAAVTDFEAQLRARGIHLIFVPLPLKPFIYPDKLWSGYPLSAGPAWNMDRKAFALRLTSAGVDVLDVTDDLWRARLSGHEELFLKLDTHWSPRGLAIVADRIAAHVNAMLPRGTHVLKAHSASVTNRGDLFRMLEIDPSPTRFAPETVQITQVIDTDRIAAGDDSSPVLLLGDSFTNIYSRRHLGWGEGAGLGEQLMLRLATGVQVMAMDGGGATAVREMLAASPQSLGHKKVVIWACSARDLFDSTITWDSIALAADE